MAVPLDVLMRHMRSQRVVGKPYKDLETYQRPIGVVLGVQWSRTYQDLSLPS